MKNTHRPLAMVILSTCATTLFTGLLLGMLLVRPVSAAPNLAQSISVNPISGLPGIIVNLTGSDYTLGVTATIRWDGTNQTSFIVPSDPFSVAFTIPVGASPGAHTITICAGCGQGEFEQTASTVFKVLTQATNTPIPPTATFTRRPPTWTPSPTPTLTPTPTATELPSVCGDLGLGAEAVVIDFEQDPATFLIPIEAEFGVRFARSIESVVPSVAAHSPNNAAKSVEAMEFGSALLPIWMRFTRGVQAVGMFVGLEAVPYVSSDVIASLTVFGYREGVGSIEELGSNSATFPPEPTDIKHCVSVRATEGDVIVSARLEYVDAFGTSLAEPRLMDDLTLVYSEIELPEDLPPEVEITLPDDGASYIGGSVDVRVEIREDRELTAVYYHLNTGGGNEVGFSSFASDPSQYMTGFGISTLDLVPYSDNRIIVTAYDRAGQEGRDQITVRYDPPTPTPSLDIIAEKAEITQVIQCLDNPDCRDNSVPLIVDRPTLVRLYVRAESGGEVPDISGEICLGDDCLPSLNRVTVSTTDDPVRDFRGDISRTLNFLLPLRWVNYINIRILNVHVNRGGTDAGECCLDNNYHQLVYTMQRGKRLNVVMMRVRAHGFSTSGDQRSQGLQWVRRYYPTSRIYIYRSSDEPVSASYNYKKRDGWSELLDDLWWSNFWTDDPVDYLRYHAMVPPDVDFGSPGMAYTPGDESGAIWFFRAGGSTGHELGHNHGLNHAPSDMDADGEVSNEACGDPKSPNNRYPQYLALDGTDLPRSSIGEWGIDLYSAPYSLKNPANTYDLLSYCFPRFMSLYTYSYLSHHIDRTAGMPLTKNNTGIHLAQLQIQQDRDYLVGGGVINPEGFQLLTGFYRLPLPADMEMRTADGPYWIELRDDQGGVLLAQAFAPQPTSDDPDPVEGSFKVIAPWVEGTALVVFLHQDQVLGGVPVSPNAPEVTLLEPNGGESWPTDGNVDVRWEASDSDGDSLVATLQFSPDGGETWRAVARDLEDSRLRVDASLIPGSDNGVVRVCVTDGVNTTCDTSDSSFTVEGKSPELYIIAPLDGAVFQRGEQVIFDGTATDLEDGAVEEDASYEWSSDLDGQLGTGQTLWGLQLSQGRHLITLVVKDRSDFSARETVTIVIGSEEIAAESQPINPVGAILLLVVIAIFGSIGVGLIIVGLRQLKR